MYQVKEFYARKHAELEHAVEAQANAWLKENPNIEIKFAQYFMAGDGDLRFIITYKV